MIKRGYSLIEVLISAAIFAGVLIGAFTVFSTVSNASRATNASRDVSYAGYSLVDTIAEIARYGTPTRDSAGALGCAEGAGVGGNINGQPTSQLAANTCVKGLYYDGNNKIGINILKNDSAVVSSYEVYEFSLVAHNQLSTFSKNGVSYNVYKPLLVRYRHHPLLSILNLYTPDPAVPPTNDLLPSSVAILVPTTKKPFSLTEGAVISTSSDKITNDQDISLSIKDAQEVPALYLTIEFSFADVDDLLTAADSATIYTYKTGVSNRTYNISFVE